MKIQAILTILLFASTASAEGFQLVGFTQESFRGDQGIFAMNAACDAQYSEVDYFFGQQFTRRARVCDVADVIRTSSVDGLALQGQAYVNSLQSIVAPPMMEPRTSCAGWSDHNYQAFTIDAQGRIGGAWCSEELPAACCRALGD